MPASSTRSQTDAEILAAVGLTDPALRIDRTDPYLFVILADRGTDEEGDAVEEIVGRAVLTSVPGAPTQRMWVLGCIDCDGEIEAIDAGMCVPCREKAAARDQQEREIF